MNKNLIREKLFDIRTHIKRMQNKKIIKKNQVLLYVLALILVSSVYLNYNSHISKEVSSKEEFEYAGIGDAKLVDNIATEENNSSENKVEEGSLVSNDEEESTIETSVKEDINDYFTSSRLERDKMYSQMLETYQKILENPNITQEQKAISSQEVANINNAKNGIMIAENLIKTKGFEDVVLFINDKSVNVVVKAEKLDQKQVAQIQNIISRELNVEISNIHISTK